jgi:hypothetical protein
MAETKEQEPPKPYRIGLNVTVSAARSLFTVIDEADPILALSVAKRRDINAMP